MSARSTRWPAGRRRNCAAHIGHASPRSAVDRASGSEPQGRGSNPSEDADCGTANRVCTHRIIRYMKVCLGCGTEKSVTEFHQERARKDGLASQCKVYRNAHYKQTY